MSKKKKPTRLRVLINQEESGFLTREATGALSFQYSDNWLEKKDNFPISYSLPLQKDMIKGAEVYTFFDNLLPDSPEIRKKVAARIEANSAQPFDLLSILGRDCVGALQLLPLDEEFTKPNLSQKVPLTEKQIAKILENLAVTHLGVSAENKLRISIAGVQEKTALLMKHKKWYLPIGMTPTTHILKPTIGILPNGIDMSLSVENEWLCLQICKFLGLPVVEAAIKKFSKINCLVVKRYDRKQDEKNDFVLRLPQEDFCQALGFNSSKRYQSDGGPGIKHIMDFLNISNQRDKDRCHFIKAQIAFHLLAATDGHAKNFSILMGPKGVVLAPIYDVLSMYPAIKHKQIQWKHLKMAMSVGDGKNYRIDYITKDHWYRTAENCNFPKRELEDIFSELNKKIKELNQKPLALPKSFPQDLYEANHI